MSRQFIIPGEVMVAVVFGAHLSGQFPVQDELLFVRSGILSSFPDPNLGAPAVSGSMTIELGLCADEIKITPRFTHSDILVNDMGKSPGDVQWLCSEYSINMRLVHYDRKVLNTCVLESMGGARVLPGAQGIPGMVLIRGDQAPAGTLMFGNLKSQITRTLSGLSPYPTDISGCHYVGLSLQPQNQWQLPEVAQQPWYFYQTYLSNPPVIIPLGTRYSTVELNWRAVPVPGFLSGGEMVSSGSYIWDHIVPSDLYADPDDL